MKLDLSSFDEKTLKTDTKEPYSLLWRLREIVKEQKHLESEKETGGMSDQTKIVELDEEFMTLLQKLVKSNLWTIVKVPLLQIKDLFNSVAERIEKNRAESGDKSQMLLLIQAAALFTSNNTSQEKVDNAKCLIEIIQKEDDIRIIGAAFEIIHQVGFKRQQGIYLLLQFLSEISEKACNLSVAPNLLRSKEHHCTLFELAQGYNTKQEKLYGQDLIFEVESPPQGLNDRSQQSIVQIPRENIVNSDLSVQELSKKIASEHGKDSEQFIAKLEAKILWVKFVDSETKLRDALITILENMSFAYSWKNENKHIEYCQYLKENYMKESMEIVSQSGDKVNIDKQLYQDLIVKVVQILYRITQKDQGSFLSLDLITKAQNQRQNDEESQRPFLVSVLEDISSIKIVEDGLSLAKDAKTNTVNQNVAKSSKFQYHFVQFAFMVIRVIQAQHNRGSTLYQDTVNMIMGSLLKIIDDIPQNENSAYAFHPKITYIVSQILKLTVRPRLEEANDIIKKFENRIVFEVQNIDKNVSVCLDKEDLIAEVDQKDRQIIVKNLVSMLSDLISRDQQNLGMGRKILETKLLSSLQHALDFNNNQTGHFIDEFLSKYITLVGSLCSDNPAITPSLIKSGIIPNILKSLSERLPQSSDQFESLIFSINQMSLHEEGQALVTASNLFKTILLKATDEKVCQNFQNDQLLLRMYMCNLFDRNPTFKDIARDCLFEYLNIIEDYINKQTIQFFEIFRRQDLSYEEKISQLNKNDSTTVQNQIQAAIIMIHNICFLSNDQMAQSRHTQEIINDQVFKRILEVFLALGSNPAKYEIFHSYLKVMKALVEYNNFAQNVQGYLDLFISEMEKFKSLLGKPLYQIQEFNFDEKEENAELQSLDQFEIAKPELYLHHGEQVLVQLSKIYSFIKATQFLHSATQHQIIQNKCIHKLAKATYYLQRISQNKKVQIFSEEIQKIQQAKDNQSKTSQEDEYQKYGKYLFTLYNANETSIEDKRESLVQIKTFFQTFLEKKILKNQIFPLREKYFDDFINKLSTFSFQMRHQHQKEALEKNLLFIGNLVYKTSKEFSKKKLDAMQIENNNQDFLQKLYYLHIKIYEFQNQLNHGWLDGASLYQFIKRGGLTNLIECFHWLSNQLSIINHDYQQIYVYLFDECCLSMKMIMTILINSRNTENNMNSLLQTNMGSDFENAKNLYQTFYHILCTKLLQLEQQQIQENQNVILKLNNVRCPYLLDVIMLLLQHASKSFSNCQLLSQSGRNDRDNAGGRRNTNRNNQANPLHVETLFNMGMGFTREKIQQALVQTHNNIDNAMNLLLEWQVQEQLGIDDAAVERQIDDGMSSGDSEQNNDIDFQILDQGDLSKINIIQQKVKKVSKVNEAQFNEIVKKTQIEGFKWIIEALKSQEIMQSKFREFLIQIMLNEKQDSIQKNMYAQIDELFKRNLWIMHERLSQLPQPVKQNEDQEMTDIIDTTQQETLITQLIKNMSQLQNDIQLIQKVINNSKPYLKEAVTKCDVPLKCFMLLKDMVSRFNDPQCQHVFNDEAVSQQYQRLLLDILIILFTLVQLTQMQINIYATSKQQVEQCQKKIKIYKLKAPTAELLKLCFTIMTAFEQQMIKKEEDQKFKIIFKKPIVATAASIALRIVMIKDSDQQPNEKQDNVQKLFDLVSRLKNQRILNQQILSSIQILHMETSKSIYFQMEKLSQKVLYLKYEYENASQDKKQQQQQQQQEQGHLLSKVALNSFLTYFQSLQIKDPESFQNALKESCEIKTIKKGEQLSQDQALIRLKESKLNDFKKQNQKERSALKTIVKSIDFHKDQQIKQQSKISKKALLTQLSEQQVSAIQVLIQQVAEKTTIIIDENQNYQNAKQLSQKYIIPKNSLTKNEYQTLNTDQIQFFETLFKLSLAYPALTVPILQSQPCSQSKRSFVNWFIKDFLVTQMLSRSVKDIKNNASELQQQQQAEEQYEVIYSLKSSTKAIDNFVFKALNNLTSYNHLMSLNEQCVKHEIRTKFILEALSILQKTIKDKNQNQVIQKCLIISCLTVIDSLLNFKNTYLIKQQAIAQDNFINSIRAAILREASTKEANLPPSFIKLADELLTDVIDVTLSSNADIINKAVSILKNLGEFINNEKKKEDRAKLSTSQLLQQQQIDDSQQKEGDIQMSNESAQQLQQQQQLQDDVMRDEESLSEEDAAVINQNDESEDGEGEDQEEEDENDQDDDEEDDEGDDEEMLYNEDEDIDGDQIELQRADVDHDLFEEDDMESPDEDEDEEIIIEDRGERRGQRQQDIIDAVDNNARDGNQIRYHGYRRYQNEMGNERRNQDWSEEESQVQRILANMRMAHNVSNEGAAGVPPHPYGHYNRPNPFHGQDDQNKKSNIIDQLFDGLNLISEKNLLDIVLGQRAHIENEIKEENKAQIQGEQRVDYQGALDQLNNARGAIIALQRRIEGFNDEIVIDYDFNFGEGGPFQVRAERPDFFQRALNQGWGMQNPLLDPMFARPNAFLNDPHFPPLGNQVFGNQNALGAAGPEAVQVEQQLFNSYVRQIQQQNQNNNEGIGQQLLQNMEVEVEEVKEEEKKVEDEKKTKIETTSNANPTNMSNEQLLANFFLPDNQVDQEIQRMEERSRELRTEIHRQQQDIQHIVDSQQRQNENQPQPDVEMQQENQPSNDNQIQQNQVEILQYQQPIIEQIQQNEQQVPPEISNFQLNIAEDRQQNLQSQEEQKQQEQIQQSPRLQQSDQSNKTFGYDNDLLIANGIEPAILLELPEELRAELLSTIDMPVAQQNPPSQEQQQVQQQEQQPNQQQPIQNVNQQEEEKQGEQNINAQNPGQSLANDLGIDPEFLANLPEDMQIELLQNEQFRQRNLGQQQQQQQPQREAEQMDLASFIATVTDPALRREIFTNMDEATIATLPPNLMAEARQSHDQIRYERARARDQFANLEERARGLMMQIDPRMARDGFNADNDPFGAIFGRRGPGAREEAKQGNQGQKSLDEIIITRQKQLCDELQNEDTTQSLLHQFTNDEKILSSLILILISNFSVECELIPCIQSLIKIHTTGLPVIRNKVISIITFLLKAFATGDDEQIQTVFPNIKLQKKQSVLILIGCLRLLLKNNRNLMKYILKGLILKEDNIQHQKQSQIFKKQFQAIKAKQNLSEVSSFDDSQNKQKLLILPPLAEIFYLIRTDLFKNDKSLLKNLSLLIHQILQQFDIALEELETSNQAISSEIVQSIAEVLSLDMIDQNLMQALGEFLYQISKKKKENFELISKYCKERSHMLLEKLNERLGSIHQTFNDIKNRISPGKMQIYENYSPSQGGDSVYEEEKNEMIIDTSNNPLLELQKKSIKGTFMKLPEEEEKLLKQQMRLSENSEVLLRIFKLFNLFYEKFKKEKVNEENKEQTESGQVISEIQTLFESSEMNLFVKKVSDLLKIIFKTNMDINEGISNLIFCVFYSFNTELIESEEQLKKSEEQANPGTSDSQVSKYQVKMLPLSESMKRQDKFILFRNSNYFTKRVEEFSNFCLANKRIINKLIKAKTQLFVNELEGLITYMPNLLDFDNKRIYFKRELAKLKRNQQHEQIQLFIRRDNIFMDSYAQLGIRQPKEMKGRLHIQFTGERGQDAGGLTRDFFIELSREMFNPNYSLFILSSSGSTYYPNPKSYVEVDHLRYFKFIGRVIGKALFDECLLECYFVKSLYKIMTGEPLTFQDLEDFDNEFFNNLKWCLENDVETLYATFVVEQDFFGRTEEIDLIEGGRKIPVNNQNKNEYIEKLTYFKLYKSIQKQIDAFLEGFYELIPKELVSLFNYKELELLISGLPNFDINDLKQNTEYMSYNANSPQVQWLWEILETFENSDRAEFLQFVTGSSKVPLDGFKGLMGMRGPQKFTIAKIKTDDILRLPSGHTCFNQIDLPEYPSKEIMHERLLTAIKETKGFGFA